ncbi:hypothetical protein RIF29_18627 [Crotalaria pallida]|uniref:Uncharacterized protein n=1 Tax=Crotalaria pallida TaxID=3830 RepID=A0AAN9I6Z8_CROPI
MEAFYSTCSNNLVRMTYLRTIMLSQLCIALVFFLRVVPEICRRYAKIGRIGDFTREIIECLPNANTNFQLIEEVREALKKSPLVHGPQHQKLYCTGSMKDAPCFERCFVELSVLF